MTLAFAISIALHEAAAGLIPPQPPAPSRAEVVTDARVLRVALRSTPRPSPQPSPRLVPLPVSAAPLVPPRARVIARGQPGHSGATPARPHSTRPIWDVSSGRATLAASLSGSGTSSGTGSGSGTQGAGSGSTSGEEPCGFVTFSDPHGSQYDSRTRGFWVDIRMSVHFADGASQSMILDYPWYYPSEAANPWSDRNLKDPAFPTRFQPPPAGKIENEPPLVQYVVAHSTADGMTLLRDCPAAASTPGAFRL